MNTGMGIKDY